MSELSPSRTPAALSGHALHTLPEPEAEAPSILAYLAALRRRFWLVLLAGTVGIGLAAFTVSRNEPRFLSSAVIQITEERAAPSGGLAGLAASLGGGGTAATRGQVIRSRLVLGEVVDSLGLRLVREISGVFHHSYRPSGLIDQVHVSPDATARTLDLTFSPGGVRVQSGSRAVSAPYGQPVEIDGVRFVVPAQPEQEQLGLFVVSRDEAIDALRAELNVFPREGTNLIDITANGYDRTISQRLANGVAEVYRQYSGRKAREQAEKRRVFVQEQLAATEALLERTQDALTAYRQREGLYSPKAKAMAQQAGTSDLELERAQLDADRRVYRALLAQVQQRGDQSSADLLRTLVSSPSIAQNPIVSGLYDKLTEFQSQRDSMLVGPYRRSVTDPDVQRLDSISKLTQQRLVAAALSHVEALDARLSALNMIQARSDSAMHHLAGSEPEEMRLALRMESIAEAAKELRQRFYTEGMTEAATLNQVALLDAALPGQLASTTSSRLLLIGLIFGVMVGGAGALVLDGLNQSIRRRDDLERHLRVPGLAVIPRIAPGGFRRATQRLPRPGRNGGAVGARGLAGDELVAATRVNSFGAEAYRTLRTNLIFSPSTPGLHSVVVTSPNGGEGKTTTAANLAVTFAQKGMRVLLVDCDLRRPRLHTLFGVAKEPGLSQLLQGEVVAERAIRPTRVPGLSVLPAGASPSISPTDLLAGDVIRSLIDALSSDYDLVVLDTPPVLVGANAAILATAVDGVLLVVRAGETDRDSAREALQQLAAVGARVAGAVLNDPNATAPRKAGAYYDDLVHTS